MEKLTEQALKKKIRNYITLNSVSKDEIRQEYNEIYDKLKEYEDKQEWISVKERLPEEYGNVLCYTHSGFICFYVYNPKNKLFNVSFDNVNCAIKVDYWMPLPQPPQMKGAE